MRPFTRNKFNIEFIVWRININLNSRPGYFVKIQIPFNMNLNFNRKINIDINNCRKSELYIHINISIISKVQKIL